MKKKKHQTKSFRNFTSIKIKIIKKKTIQLHKKFAKVKSVLTTQIYIENVKLTNFLYKRRVLNINSSTYFCNHQE